MSLTHYDVDYSTTSRQQLAGIEDYIVDQDAPVYAYDFTGRITEFCDELGLFPRKHTKRFDIYPNLHTVGFEGSVLIAYVVKDESNLVIIEGIFYGGQNWEAALKSMKFEES